jgi:1-phosphatidylinositol-4-phosphate 5-kinase
LRKKFNVNEVDFLHALGETDLKEVSNPGASGSVFYKTSNDKYILKTVQYQECEFLKTLLAGYTLNLLQNLINGKFSLLPTIYGLYCYQKMELTSMLSDKTNIRIVIMNNILPSDVPIHEKYDLKGSLYKRKASKQERAKSSPTYKDIDFLAEHPEGLMLDEKQYENIINSLKRDCLILESFGIMDYSMLLGIHNLEKERNNTAIEAYYEAKVGDPLPQAAQTAQTHSTLSAERANSTSNESVQPSTSSANQSVSSPMPSNYKSSMSSTSKSNWDNVFNMSAVPARSAKNERLLIYFGIIDILQSYRIKKRLEHAFKRLITDGDTVSVCPPDFYAKRFIDFMTQKVFKKATMKGSPVRKRLTFKLEKKEDQHQSLHSPVNSQFQLTTPLGTTTQKTFSPALQTNPTSPTNFKNFNQIKPIDSVDSVVGLMDSQQAGDNPNTTSLSKSYINSQSKKISNIEELADTESSLSETNKYTSNDNDNDNNNKKYFDNINNDNDTSRQGGGTNRAPITHIIKHYENKPHYLEEKKRSNSPLSTKSISMKLEPHSPTQLRSFRNYDREQHLPTSSSNNSPNKFNDTNKSIGVSYVSRNKRIILNNQPTSPLNDKHEFEIVTKL